MLKKLQIENFQSHENTVIDFDPKVNVIFGMSQSGKTAILRALRLLVANRPLGGRFFSDSAGEGGETKVTLTLDDGREVGIVKRIRAKDGKKEVVEGQYRIGDAVFSATKDQVPDQIANALNVSELNIQHQFDAPFLIAGSPGEIARTINTITKLENVDAWISNLTSEINQTNRDIVRMEEEAKSIMQELQQYAGIDDLEEVVGNLVSVDKELSSLRRSCADLDDFLEEYEKAAREHDKLVEFLSAERYLKKAEKIQVEIQRYYALRDALREYENEEDKIGECADRLARVKGEYVDLLRAVKKCPTCFADMDARQLKKVEAEL